MPYFALTGYEGLLRFFGALHLEALLVGEQSSASGRNRTFDLCLIRTAFYH